MKENKKRSRAIRPEMQKYDVFNWIVANILASLGICLFTKSDFGLSMLAAPPYILHVWLRDIFPEFTQGTAEYVVEAIVLLVTCLIIRQFKFRYLLSFLEAVVFGQIIDAWFLVFHGNGPYSDLSLRIFAMISGLLLLTLGVAFFFRTSLPLQAYDLAVIEIIKTYQLDQQKTKQIFDATFFAISLILSFALTGKLTGIGINTILATVFTAPLIQGYGKIIDRLENRL